MFKFLSGLVDSNEKELKRLQPLVDKINSLEPEYEKLSDTELRAKTNEFKARIKDGISLDELLPEAFAAVREAAKRTIGQRHFDVQLMGGIVLHQGKIAEMKTGEGKTLVATLPLYLNSLSGDGCHLVTVNDYLARRDPYWMGPIYHKLGVSVSSIYPQQAADEHTPSRLYDPDFDSGDKRWPHFRPVSRRQAYEADITYGTSAEFGFDYLRDNMVLDLSQCVQRPSNYAIVDEVDNLLIDEARTPLIISAPSEEAAQNYQTFARLVPHLKPEIDYTIHEKERNVTLTDDGISNVEGMLRREGLLKEGNLYDQTNYPLTRYLESALKAETLYKRDKDYVVKDFNDNKGPQVIIVDEFTGRLMIGRRYSEGLHQAIEAKEHVKVQQETRTFATITIQNYFRMYDKLAGMTGTALTEAEEFSKIYQLEVVVIPTNKPMIREDFPDRIYKDEKAKFKAVVNEIEQLHKENRPVLIGTVSIEKSEMLSDLLNRKGIPHQVLNAKEHVKEGEIIAQAGEPGRVTVATNMAGRGVDIILGGNPEFLAKNELFKKGLSDIANPEEYSKLYDKFKIETDKVRAQILQLGGLHILGTERHEARRIDNQLRGRAGRQGDPGSTRFYVSLEDDIMKRFGGDRVKGIMEWAGMDENTPIENKLVNRAIENAQIKVEGYHFDMRKHLVEYDDVVNKHRELIYDERRKILDGADLKSNIMSMITEEFQSIIDAHISNQRDGERDITSLIADAAAIMPLPPELHAETLSPLKPEEIEEMLTRYAEALYEQHEKEFGSASMRVLERLVMLRTIDTLWIDHLTAMEYMRQEAGWQSLRQVRPVDAYKSEGFKQFQLLEDTIRHDVVHTIFHVGIKREEGKKPAPSPMAKVAVASSRPSSNKAPPAKAAGKKVGRNDPCPCGSGKKYKHCCGK